MQKKKKGKERKKKEIPSKHVILIWSKKQIKSVWAVTVQNYYN